LGWVNRKGGHVEVWGDEAFSASSQQARGFTIFKENGGLVVEWKSGLNLDLDSLGILPVSHRQTILDAIRAATGQSVISR